MNTRISIYFETVPVFLSTVFLYFLFFVYLSWFTQQIFLPNVYLLELPCHYLFVIEQQKQFPTPKQNLFITAMARSLPHSRIFQPYSFLSAEGKYLYNSFIHILKSCQLHKQKIMCRFNVRVSTKRGISAVINRFIFWTYY